MKKCGHNEPCFEKGECWGHFEDVMCKHLGENDFNISMCYRYNIPVETYKIEWSDEAMENCECHPAWKGEMNE